MAKITVGVLAATALIIVTVVLLGGGRQITPAEQDYLTVIRETSDRPDEELLDAAHAACDQILEGRDIFQVRVFDDDTNADGFYHDSVRVALAAAPRLCPDLA